MFDNLKNKALGMLVRSQLKKAGLPEAQIEMLVELIIHNPDFFKKIEREVQEKKKQGMNEQAAMMHVMRTHQSELQRLVMNMQSSKS